MPLSRLSINTVVSLTATLLSSLTAVAVCLLLVITTAGSERQKIAPAKKTAAQSSVFTEAAARREQKFLECRYLAPKSSEDIKAKQRYRECLRRIAFDGDLPPDHRE
ncbi:MAG: hypothetical protein ABF461_06790 [Zymomonas mobilis subsp. pomaceae]|uniref:hypothetical protein n=1 Tax=Zymomonas mobilis TaxID=542 RepID=UPI0039E73EF8